MYDEGSAIDSDPNLACELGTTVRDNVLWETMKVKHTTDEDGASGHSPYFPNTSIMAAGDLV